MSSADETNEFESKTEEEVEQSEESSSSSSTKPQPKRARADQGDAKRPTKKRKRAPKEKEEVEAKDEAEEPRELVGRIESEADDDEDDEKASKEVLNKRRSATVALTQRLRRGEVEVLKRYSEGLYSMFDGFCEAMKNTNACAKYMPEAWRAPRYLGTYVEEEYETACLDQFSSPALLAKMKEDPSKYSVELRWMRVRRKGKQTYFIAARPVLVKAQ